MNTGRTHFTTERVARDKNVNWRGDRVKYSGIHMWVRNNFGLPDTCEHCGNSGLSGKYINWANVSGDYKRDREDWKRLCKKCHVKFDDTINRGWATRRAAGC